MLTSENSVKAWTTFEREVTTQCQIPWGSGRNPPRRTRFPVFAFALQPNANAKASALRRTYVYCLNRRCSQWLIPSIQPNSLTRQSLKDLPWGCSSWPRPLGWVRDTYEMCFTCYFSVSSNTDLLSRTKDQSVSRSAL